MLDKQKYFEEQVEYLGMAPSQEHELLKMIEASGRTCYKSEDKITEDSMFKFLNMILNLRHLSVLEHSNIVIEFDLGTNKSKRSELRSVLIETLTMIGRKDFFKIHETEHLIVGSNLRGWIELISHLCRSDELYLTVLGKTLERNVFTHYPKLHNLLSENEYFKSHEFSSHENFGISNSRVVDTEEQLKLLKNNNYDLPVFVFRMVTDRGITHELVRNRSLQYSQESTRYVNYHKKIGMMFYDLTNEASDSKELVERMQSEVFENCEEVYNYLVSNKLLHPQIARNLLPHSLRAEIVVSGRYGRVKSNAAMDLDTGWSRFLNIRNQNAAHTYIRRLAEKVNGYFLEILENS